MIDVGNNQGRTGESAEGSRAITELILRRLVRDYWPLAVLALGFVLVEAFL